MTDVNCLAGMGEQKPVCGKLGFWVKQVQFPDPMILDELYDLSTQRECVSLNCLT